jgi:hypothetical protein
VPSRRPRGDATLPTSDVPSVDSSGRARRTEHVVIDGLRQLLTRQGLAGRARRLDPRPSSRQRLVVLGQDFVLLCLTCAKRPEETGSTFTQVSIGRTVTRCIALERILTFRRYY